MSSQDYQYEALVGTRQIRLLKLEQPCRDSIRCSLITVSLDVLPTFHAVSYCWGPEGTEFEISVNDARLQVRANLHALLQELEQSEKELLWIDAICIDQSNIQERQQQVQLMGEVYGRASLTIVWLGRADGSGELGPDIIQEWTDLSTTADSGRPVMPGQDQWNQLVSTWFLSMTAEKRQALRNFFDREWWSRMWVYQEFVLSQVVNFQIGSKLVAQGVLDNFAAAYYDLHRKLESMGFEPAIMDEFNSIQALQYSKMLQQKAERCLQRHSRVENDPPPMGLLDLLTWTRDLKATDPRDKLFALLGVDAKRDIAITPSYTDLVSKVYLDFVTACVQANDHLNFIARGGIGSVQGSNELASWVWDLRRTGTGQCISDATHNSAFSLVHRARVLQATLQAHGIACDRVSTMSDFYETPKLDDWLKWFLFVSEQGHPTEVPVEQAFFRTLIGDDRDYVGGPNQSRTTNAEWRDHAIGFIVGVGRKLFEQNSQIEQLRVLGRERQRIRMSGNAPREFAIRSPQVIRFIMHAQKATLHKRFFTTLSGYFGLGPPGMEQGDQIFVLYGCKVPLMLRKAGESYILVGECYIFGMMQGEMVLKHREGLLDEEMVQIV